MKDMLLFRRTLEPLSESCTNINHRLNLTTIDDILFSEVKTVTHCNKYMCRILSLLN